MNAEIIAVGSEILSGRQLDTNSHYIAEQLKNFGIQLERQTVVPDIKRSIQSALADALGRSNIVIMTGGLGPTPDDITKQAVCELLQIELVIDEASRAKIEMHFMRKGEKMSDNNLRQALVPQGSDVLKNKTGLAAGAILKSGNQSIILLPGPPSEMEPMFENGVKPFLRTVADECSVVKTVNVFGMSESLIANALGDLLEKENPYVATYAEIGRTDVVVSSHNPDIKLAVKETDIAVDEITRRLGDYIYGYDEPSFQHAVVSELISKKLTVATAESCTGGLLSSKITEIAGSSVCFGYGMTTYSEDAKRNMLGVEEETLETFSAVSAETACQMSVGVMQKSGADIGVSITGYAGPAASVGEPVGLVFVSVCNRETVWVKRLELGGANNDRNKIRELASLHALDMVRRVIDDLSIFNSQRMPISEIHNSVQNERSEKSDVFYKDENGSEDDTNDVKSEKHFWDVFIPKKTDSQPIKIRKTGILTALAALIISAIYIASFFFGIISNKNTYLKLEALKDKEVAESVQYPPAYLEDFALLYNKNKNIAGWISIPNTELSYPVMQGEDNSFYLNHNFYGKKNRHGVPFMDYRNDKRNLNVNTVIYGNNMKSDGQMFTSLKYYYEGNQSIVYYREHPLVEFDTVYKKMKWKIFAVFTCNVDDKNGEVFRYYDMLSPSSDEEYEQFIDEAKQRSIFNIPVDVKANDKIITLSTEYSEFEGQRLVVMARLLRDGENENVEVNDVTYNRGGEKQETTVSRKTSSKRTTSTLSRPTISSQKTRSFLQPAVSKKNDTSPSYTTWSGLQSEEEGPKEGSMPEGESAYTDSNDIPPDETSNTTSEIVSEAEQQEEASQTQSETASQQTPSESQASENNG